MRLQDLYRLRYRHFVWNTDFHVYVRKVVAKRHFPYLYSILHFYLSERVCDYFLCSGVLESFESVLRHEHNVLEIVLEGRYILIFCLNYTIHTFISATKIRPRKAATTLRQKDYDKKRNICCRIRLPTKLGEFYQILTFLK